MSGNANVFTKGSVALITGGASGIGLAVAHHCRKSGMRVAIADRNIDLLAKAKTALAYDAADDVLTYDMDVSSVQDWSKLKSDLSKAWGNKIGFLHLNAGIGLKGTWGDDDYFQKIIATNLFGVINGLNSYVQTMKEQTGPSAIIITGSKQGITNPPGNAAYNASKSAVKTLAEHLSFDLKDTPISVHLLVPGWTFTGLSGGAPGSDKKKPAGAWTSEQVADYLISKMEEGKFYVICPDNDVTPELDKKRMMWTTGDIVYERPPLTRWRKEYAEESKKWMDENNL